MRQAATGEGIPVGKHGNKRAQVDCAAGRFYYPFGLVSGVGVFGG